jgi:hypothetical protein
MREGIIFLFTLLLFPYFFLFEINLITCRYVSPRTVLCAAYLQKDSIFFEGREELRQVFFFFFFSIKWAAVSIKLL